MRKLVYAVALLASSLAFADLKAEFASIEATEQTCLNTPAGMSDMGMDACVGTAFDAADKLLNATYAPIYNQLKQNPDQTMFNQLVKTELSWIAYRDQFAALAASVNAGGTLARLDLISAKYYQTKIRTLELSYFARSVNNP